MAHPGDLPPPRFSVSNVLNTPTIHRDPQNGPPPHWHGHPYPTMQAAAHFQTPSVNTSYADQGYRGRDGRGPDGPVHPEEQYQFSLRPVVNSAAQIDPTLLRDDREHGPFVHPKHRVEHEHRPCSKKEVRAKPSHKPKKSKGKGKGRVGSSESESDADDARGKTRTGRGGVQNYNKVAKDLLFDTVEEVLPTGEKGWKSVEAVYNAKAMSVGRPERAAGSPKTKYQSYTKQKKPTGTGEFPPEVKRAHEIEDLINTKAGTRDLDDDSELDNDDNDDSNDSDVPKVVEPVRSAVARRATSPPLRRSHTSATDAVSKIVHSLDPATLRVRDEARAHHSFERTQLMTLSAQVDGLRSQLSAVLQENNNLKREQDRADMERTWAARLDKVTRRRSYDRSYGRSRSPSHHRRRVRRRGRTTFAERDGIQCVGGKVRVEHQFSDGGAATFWETEASSDATDFDHRLKKKQRKRSRTPYRGRTPTPSPPHPRPLSRRRTPTPGPSQLPFTSNTTSDALVSGNAVELIVTPRRGGAPLGFIISPTTQRD
ncbi:hypothetical protein B0H19DRAFT_1266668 [Mycena capillaripes]|nr:hypothetical protein B0H19DRAFT_1266668 [Mycena capillaripes]